jgi:hypothetical protein
MFAVKEKPQIDVLRQKASQLAESAVELKAKLKRARKPVKSEFSSSRLRELEFERDRQQAIVTRLEEKSKELIREQEKYERNSGVSLMPKAWRQERQSHNEELAREQTKLHSLGELIRAEQRKIKAAPKLSPEALSLVGLESDDAVLRETPRLSDAEIKSLEATLQATEQASQFTREQFRKAQKMVCDQMRPELVVEYETRSKELIQLADALAAKVVEFDRFRKQRVEGVLVLDIVKDKSSPALSGLYDAQWHPAAQLLQFSHSLQGK